MADIFEKSLSEALTFHKLDPSHYFSSHGLSCDAMFKMTGVKLELTSGIKIHLFIEKRLRGVVSYIL